MSEEKQNLSFLLKGKRFAYEGFPQNKERDLFDFMVKMKAPDDIVIETFKSNLPELANLSDEEIWSRFAAAKEAKARAKAEKEKAKQLAAQQAEVNSAGAGQEPPPVSVVTLATQTNAASIVTKEDPPTSVSSFEKGQEKLIVYLSMEGTQACKIIHVPPSIPFDEFMALVEKKFGLPLVLSFVDGEDKIEVDDDDGLGYFFEQEVKRRKMTCSMPKSKHSAAHCGTNTAYPDSGESKNSKEESTMVATFGKENSGPVYCCSFAPNGEQFIATSRDQCVRVWNVQNGCCKEMHGRHTGCALSCDFSPDGIHAVSSGADGLIKLWNTDSATKVNDFLGHDDKVSCSKFNASGAYVLTASCDKTLRVFNADVGEQQSVLRGHTLPVFSCCFGNQNAGKFVASASDDRLVKIWDWRDQKEVKSLIGHTGTVWSCRFSHDDKHIVSASMQNEISVWDVGMGRVVHTIEVPTYNRPGIHDVLFTSKDKYILSCGKNCSVNAWCTFDASLVETLKGHQSAVYHMDLLGEKLLTCSMDETIKLWSMGSRFNLK